MGRTIDFEKIQLTDDIMFSSVLGNPEHCQEFLERILGFKIKELHIMESQKSMKPGLYSKGIRLDIYAKDEQGNAYDIEMQLLDTGELDLRSRYYHSEMDRYQIQVGQKYSELQESIVIFVCNFDMFKKNRSIYTFETLCVEDTKIHLQDKRKTVFVNIRGNREGLQTNLVNLLDYLSTNQPTDEYTHKLQHRVLEMRDDTEWRENYMTWEMKLDERYEAGRKEELCRLIKKKLEKGKNIAQIADECEETEERILELMEKMEKTSYNE